MTLAHGTRVHWFRLISDLRRLGMTMQEIAQRLQEPRKTVERWQNGSEPGHARGERLIALWSTLTTLPRESVPTIAEGDWRE